MRQARARQARGLRARWRLAATLLATALGAGLGAGCFDAADQIRARGQDNLTGRWHVVSYRSAERLRAQGGVEFGADGVMRERLRFAGQDAEARGGEGVRRDRDRGFEVEPGVTAGTFELRLEGGQTLAVTFAPSGRLLVAWPAETGRGWVRLPAKVVLERVGKTQDAQ